MDFPKYLLGDNSDYPTAIFVIHTEFPRFIINLEDDEVEWLEDFDKEDQKELEEEAENLIQQATDFYDREIARYDEEWWFWSLGNSPLKANLWWKRFDFYNY